MPEFVESCTLLYEASRTFSTIGLAPSLQLFIAQVCI